MDLLFWSIVSAIGDIRFWAIALAALCVLLYVRRPNPSKRVKRAIVILIITVAVVSLVAEGLKIAINEPRICTPCINGLPDGCTGQIGDLLVQADTCPPCNPYCPNDHYAFPSGHATLSFAVFTAMWLAFPRNRREHVQTLWLFVFPILVSASRIVLGVHTLDQVVAGVALGVAVAIAVFLSFRKFA